MCSRVFVVTGANKGIGYETVRELAKRLKSENATIVLCARDAIRGQVIAELHTATHHMAATRISRLLIVH